MPRRPSHVAAPASRRREFDAGASIEMLPCGAHGLGHVPRWERFQETWPTGTLRRAGHRAWPMLRIACRRGLFFRN